MYLMSLLGQLFSEHWHYPIICHHWNSRLCHGVWWMHLLTGKGMCRMVWSNGRVSHSYVWSCSIDSHPVRCKQPSVCF